MNKVFLLYFSFFLFWTFRGLAAPTPFGELPLEERPTEVPKPKPKPKPKAPNIKKRPSIMTNKPDPKHKAPKVLPSELMGPPKKSDDAAEMLYPDEIGKKVSHLVVGLANRLDSFFGEERSDDEKNGSTLRLVPSYTYYDNRKPVTEMGVNLNLKLINLESKAKKLETSLREGILETAGQPKPGNRPKGPGLEEEETWHYNFESKLAARPAIYYSGKLRVRRNFDGEFFLNHFSLSAGWDTDDYWSQKTGFQSDHALNESVLFRFINEANWFITKKSFQTTHGPSLIQTINKYNSVSYNFRMLFGIEKNDFEHLESSYSINYRHGTPSKRIFIDLIPAYTYPRSESYGEIRSFEIRLEYFFGDVE